jgi:glycosyltransferase involved in cell wall biosynthesis
MKGVKVSVVIPSYGCSDSIRDCISSLERQTYRNHEIIIVDSGPGDCTKRFVESMLKSDTNVKYIFQENLGIGTARHAGEVTSSGEIILMTDSDCVVPDDWIEKMVRPINDGLSVAVQGLKRASRRNYWACNAEREEHEVMTSFFRDNGTSLVDTANFAIRSDVLSDIGFTDGTLPDGNDVDLAARLHSGGHKVMLGGADVYHDHPSNASDVFRKMFRRGSWYCRIRMRSPGGDILRRETATSTFAYVAGLVSDIARLDGRLAYHLLTGVSWRMGLLWGHVRK